jgi:hypothetical protein
MLTLDRKTRYLASLNARIDGAVRAVQVAQDELAAAVDRLVPVSVGDNKLITRGLEGSFEKVRVAQYYVCDLQQLRARV